MCTTKPYIPNYMRSANCRDHRLCECNLFLSWGLRSANCRDHRLCELSQAGCTASSCGLLRSVYIYIYTYTYTFIFIYTYTYTSLVHMVLSRRCEHKSNMSGFFHYPTRAIPMPPNGTAVVILGTSQQLSVDGGTQFVLGWQLPGITAPIVYAVRVQQAYTASTSGAPIIAQNLEPHPRSS